MDPSGQDPIDLVNRWSAAPEGELSPSSNGSNPTIAVLSPSQAPRESPPASQMGPWLSFLVTLERAPNSNVMWREDLLDDAILHLTRGEVPSALRALTDGADHLAVTCKEPSPRRLPARDRGLRRPTALGDSGGRRARREQFKNCQRLYGKNRSAAAAHVLSGDWRVPPTSVGPDALFPFWGNLFSRPSEPDSRPITDQAVGIDHLADPIAMEEITSCLRETKTSAPGPDGITTRMLKSIPVRILCKMYNLWLATGSLPGPLKANRTVLIPKVPNPSEPKDYRPITISCAVVRLLHKIISSRISRSVEIDKRQKAFVPVDGCLENLTILDAIIGRARSHTHGVNLAFLDMAKAFDSVYHGTIERAMLRKGIPSPVRKYIMSTYDQAYTNIVSPQGDSSDDISMSRGVKQGDPLSPILFNLVIDEAVARVRESGMGIRIGEQRVPILAFADDLVLVAESAAGLQKIVDIVTATLAGGGLHVNPAKCRSLSLGVDGKNRTWYVDQHQTFRVDGTAIGSMGPDDDYKYLGVLFGAGGRKVSYGRLLEEGLANITQAPLKPQQRIAVLIQYLVPRLMHRLVLGVVYKTQLGRMDRQVRQAVRSWLRLPGDVPMAVFHSAPGDGGLGIPDFVSTVRLQKQSRLEKLFTSGDEVVRAAAREPVIAEKLQRWSGPARIAETRVSNNIERQRGWRSNLIATCDGAGLASNNLVPQTNKWVTSGTRLMTGRDYVRAVQVRAARGRPGIAGICEICRCPGTLGHMVQVCPRTHGGRIKRHNDVNSFVAGRLRQRGYEVFIEPRIPVAGSYRKPDLVVSKGEETVILDTQVSSDRYALSAAHKHKCEYYGTPEVFAGVRELTGRESVRVSSITLNWRGAWSRESASALKGLGLTYSDMEICTIKALTWTHSLYRMWSKSTGRGARDPRVR